VADFVLLFLFTEPTLLRAVIAAHHRGVNVRVMLNPARRNGKSENAKARKALPAAGVAVRDGSAAFALTHQKSMVIDDKTGFVESLNWEPRDLTETRDYAVTTTKKNEVKEMIRCFDADWARKPFKPDPKSRLLWCPNNGRERIAAVIDGAKTDISDQARDRIKDRSSSIKPDLGDLSRSRNRLRKVQCPRLSDPSRQSSRR
jgi:cardiolipin synthase